MFASLLAPMLLVLSLLHTTVLAGAAQDLPGAVLVPRQQPAAAVATGPSAPECLDYARTANVSVVGTNSTLRSAYLQSSMMGTLANQRMFNAAQAKLPALTANVALNSQCMNWTAIALVESGRNYSMRVILDVKNVVENPQAIKAGPELIAIVLFMISIFYGVWCFAP